MKPLQPISIQTISNDRSPMLWITIACLKIQLSLMPNFSTDFSKLLTKISRYDSPVILSSIKIKLPRPDDGKQPQHLTLLPSCLTAGMVHLGPNSSLAECHTLTFPSDPERLNLLSSDQSTLFQKSKGFSR